MEVHRAEVRSDLLPVAKVLPMRRLPIVVFVKAWQYSVVDLESPTEEEAGHMRVEIDE